MRQTDKRSAGLHVGSASIIMIFAVLCLTVFSTLSYMTAAQEQNLAQKSALAMEQYYVADWRCEETYEQIEKLLASGASAGEIEKALDVQITQQGSALCMKYAEAIDDRQELRVQLISENGKLRTTEWRVAATAQQIYNDEITVWDGE